MEEGPSLADIAITDPLYKHLTPASLLKMRTLSKRFFDDPALNSEYMRRSYQFERDRHQAFTFLCNLVYGLILAYPPPPRSASTTFGFKIDRKSTGVNVVFEPNIVRLTHKPSRLTYVTDPMTVSRADIWSSLMEFMRVYLNTVTPKVFSNAGTIVGFTIISKNPLQKTFVDKLRAATKLHKPCVKTRKQADSKYILTIDFNFTTPLSELPPPYEPPMPPSPPNALQRDSAVRSAIQSTSLIGTAESQSLLSRGALTQRTDRMRDETLARIASLRLR